MDISDWKFPMDCGTYTITDARFIFVPDASLSADDQVEIDWLERNVS